MGMGLTDCQKKAIFKRPLDHIRRMEEHTMKLFTAPVIYIQPPFEELQLRFPTYVDPLFRAVRFEPNEACKDVSIQDRVVAFRCLHLDRRATRLEVFAEMFRSLLRPALFTEYLGFAKHCPEEIRTYRMAVFGSEAIINDRFGRRVEVPYSWCRGGDLVLNMGSSTKEWESDFRFLAVPL